jgi:hypothetical protein
VAVVDFAKPQLRIISSKGKWASLIFVGVVPFVIKFLGSLAFTLIRAELLIQRKPSAVLVINFPQSMFDLSGTFGVYNGAARVKGVPAIETRQLLHYIIN